MTGQIGCGEAVRRMWEFLDRGLDEPDHEAVGAHLALCLRCCGELGFARELRRLLRTRSGGAMPEDVNARLQRFIAGLDDRASDTGGSR